MIEKLPLTKDFPDKSKNSRLILWLTNEIYTPIARRINWLLNFFTSTDDGEGGEHAPGFGPVSYIDFDIEYSDGQKEGRLQWNIDDGTLEVGMPGGSVNLQIGQEMLIRATNDEGSQIDNGSVVYISGATGANPLIKLADADVFEESLVIGVATEDILNAQKGFVTTTGLVRDIDTTSCAAGDILWLSSTAGEFTNVRPTAPVSQRVIGICLRSHATEGVIYVNVDIIPTLDGLSNVFTDGVHDLDLLSWNEENERWENDANPWDDLRIVPGSFQRAGSSDPTLYTWTPTGTGDSWLVYKFNKDDIVYASTQMPHTYKEGSDLEFHIHWTPADRGDEESGSLVGWKVGYSIANVNGDFPQFQTVDLSDACSGVDDRHEITASATVSGTGLTISHIVLLRIFRSDTGADDTWAGTGTNAPGLLEFDIHYQKNTLGSRLETSK